LDGSTFPVGASDGLSLGPFRFPATITPEATLPAYEDISAASSPTPSPMDTLTPVKILPTLPPPPPTVESIYVGTYADLEILYSREIAPGLDPQTLPWGLAIVDVVQYLFDHPTLHVYDVLRQILPDPRYPKGTQRVFLNLSTVV